MGKHEEFIVGLVNAYEFVGNPIMRNLRPNGLLNDSQTTRMQYVYATWFKGNGKTAMMLYGKLEQNEMK